MANPIPPRQHQHYRLDVALKHLMDECEDGPHRAALTYVFSAMKAEYLLVLDALISPGVLIIPLVVHRLQNLNRHLSYFPITARIPVRTGNNPDPVQHSKKISYEVSLIIKESTNL